MASKQECKWTCDLCKKEAIGYSNNNLPLGWDNYWICKRNNLSEPVKNIGANMIKLSHSYFARNSQEDYDAGWFWNQVGYAVEDWIEEMDERYADE